MARERANTVEREAPVARRAGGFELARSAGRLGDQLPLRARVLLSLQQRAGNRAVRGLVQRLRSAEAGLQVAPVQRSGNAVSPAGLADGHGRRDQVVQRSFDHKGKKKEATTYGPKAPSLPKIHGVSETDLRSLADDAHDYGAIENKQQFEAAWLVYQQRHPKQVEVVPLDEEQDGNVTVLDLDNLEQTQFAGTVRMTLQLDWLQGKHDGPFMIENSTRKVRKSGENQMRLSLAQYETLANGAPLRLAKARLAGIFGKPERAPLDFSVMGAQQSDGLYYEISAKWASVAGARHVLVYYHCFPDEKDQKKFGFDK